MTRETGKIRLVATDMDHTLLNEERQIPADFFGIVKTLENVRFVIASGRQYYNILKECAPIKDRIFIIAENGAIAAEGENIYFTETMAAEVALQIAARALSVQDASFILCGVNSAYAIGGSPENLPGNARAYYERVAFVPVFRIGDIEKILQQDQILKIAVYSHKHAQDRILPAFATMDEDALGVQTVLSGQSWVDIMKRGVNKGRALREIQKKCGVLPEECMAFGDYLNDREMLSVCRESYAMKNGHPDLIREAKHIAPSNDEAGVVTVLKKVFDL